MLSLLLFVAGLAFTQTASEREISDFARQAVIRALNFKQGDLANLTSERTDFTPEGWKKFIQSMSAPGSIFRRAGIRRKSKI